MILIGQNPQDHLAALKKHKDTGETGRFRKFTRQWIAEGDDALDISWFKDDNAESSAGLPNPAVLATSAMGKEAITIMPHGELTALIASSRRRLAVAVNAELTLLYWSFDQRLFREVLGGNRAAYGSRVIEQSGTRITADFGRGFETNNLRRMIKFTGLFPDSENGASLMRQLS